ncbi:MAG TPA: hypothetical protein VFO39_21310 [Candidatus Sulfotelmatobacter sp.]|nr:hypothetical protein [Candidatus Sulfotelmatobacter sp.]
MNTSEQRISAYTLRSLIRKMHSDRFPAMSPRMAALVGFIVGASFIEPPIADLRVSTAGTVLARIEGESVAKHVIGEYGDLLCAWHALVSAAGLSKEEFVAVECLFAQRVGFFGPTVA